MKGMISTSIGVNGYITHYTQFKHTVHAIMVTMVELKKIGHRSINASAIPQLKTIII